MENDRDIIDEIDNLTIVDGEDEIVAVPEEGNGDAFQSYEYAMVGTFLTKAMIYLEAMRNSLADYWKPEHGVDVVDLGANRYLFQFFHEVDLLNVLEGGPYKFNNHLLVFSRVNDGEDPLKIPLIYSTMWVQVYDLIPGSFSEGMARVLGNFIGKYVDYDAKAITRGNQDFMHIRVRIDVRLPLKRKKKVSFGRGREGYVRFQYEKLTLFCFLCGVLGHHDRSCRKRFQEGGRDLALEWSIDLRAPMRREMATSPYLRVGGIKISDRKIGPSLVEDSAPTIKDGIGDNNFNGDNSGNILKDISKDISAE